MLGIGDVMKLLGSSEGDRLIKTVKRLIDSQQLTIQQVAEHLDRLERVSSLTGKPIKQVSDEALALYEKSIGI